MHIIAGLGGKPNLGISWLQTKMWKIYEATIKRLADI
jgi:hypothetical protein